MKKIISGLIILTICSLFVFTEQTGAKVERVISTCSLTGPYTIEFTCTLGCSEVSLHIMNITLMDIETGEFSGNGYHKLNPSYTWEISGTVSLDSSLEFVIAYTGSNPGYTMVYGEGIIANLGELSGAATSDMGQTFDWETISGAAGCYYYEIHGRFVSKQSHDVLWQMNKKESARSRIGMPLNSKGHTK